MTPEETEQFRRQCEARWVLEKFSTKEERRKWLDRIEARRGIEGRKYLEAEIMRQWRNEKRS